jgi:hypothetical protein
MIDPSCLHSPGAGESDFLTVELSMFHIQVFSRESFISNIFWWTINCNLCDVLQTKVFPVVRWLVIAVDRRHSREQVIKDDAILSRYSAGA